MELLGKTSHDESEGYGENLICKDQNRSKMENSEFHHKSFIPSLKCGVGSMRVSWLGPGLLHLVQDGSQSLPKQFFLHYKSKFKENVRTSLPDRNAKR